LIPVSSRVEVIQETELGLDPFEAPPPLRAPPDFLECVVDFADPDDFGAEQH
jgi:hypothetical protein